MNDAPDAFDPHVFDQLIFLLSGRELRMFSARAKRNGLEQLAEILETEIAERLSVREEAT
jgi:hypothetical protein